MHLLCVKSGYDAVEEIKLLVDVVLSKKGGEGCVREFIDRFILSIED